MKQFIRCTFIVLLFVVSHRLFAQETSSCAFKLQEAESLYETGILDSIPSMLRTCINNKDFDKEELTRAYKLLILTYQFQDYQEMAELTMLKFLKEFPEYELKTTDPVEFKYLYQSFNTIPTFSIGIILGGNGSYTRIIEPYSEDGLNDYQGEYSTGYKFQSGLQFIKYINEEIDVNLDVILTLKSFDYSINQLDYITTYTENQSILSFPLTGTYNFDFGKVNPFVRAGFNFDFLLSAKADFKKENGEFTTEDINEKDYDIITDRNALNFSAVVGAGLKYNIKMGYLMLDLRYNLGFVNAVNGENRYDNLKYGQYNYVDDDFTLNNFYISFGYVYSFYKTKKK